MNGTKTNTLTSPCLLESENEPDRMDRPATRQSSWIDLFLRHYLRFLSSASNQDRALKLLQWTLKFLSTHSKHRLVLQKLGSDVSNARYVTRFLGLPDSIDALRSGSWGGDTPLSQRLGRVMAWSMVVYYPCEHLAFLRWTAPDLLKSVNASKMSAYSCRAWFVYIVAETMQSIHNLRDLYNSRQKLLKDGEVSR